MKELNYEQQLPKAVVDLTTTHLDRVVMVVDDNSVSTLGNATTVTRRFLPRVIRKTPRSSPENSELNMYGQSVATMGSRVSQIEDKISTLEENIKITITNIMEEILKKFMSSQNEHNSVG